MRSRHRGGTEGCGAKVGTAAGTPAVQAAAPQEARMACVALPALPLQWALKQHPTWRNGPVVVVVQPDPVRAPIAWVNQHARALNIKPGMAAGTARVLASDLQVAVVQEAQLHNVLEEIGALLRPFTPRIEPASHNGVQFFLDPSGMSLLFGSFQEWAARVHAAVAAAGYEACVAVGFNRACLAALGQLHTGVWVSTSPAQESTLARAVPLQGLALPPHVAELLALLGVYTLGDFLALPSEQVRSHLGPEAALVYRLVHAPELAPLCAQTVAEPVAAEVSLPWPCDEKGGLLQAASLALEDIVQQLQERCQKLAALSVMFHASQATQQCCTVRPAAPTLQGAQILELLRLHIDAMKFPHRVVKIAMCAEAATVYGRQLDADDALASTGRRRRDPAAAQRALVRLQAMFGPAAVTRARLKPGHLPEAKFDWQAVDAAAEPLPEAAQFLCSAAPGAGPILVRRFCAAPRVLHHSPVVSSATCWGGPYRFGGAWWARRIARDYYFFQTAAGAILWTYFDSVRQQWFVHGWVE